jgi:hypothetical protein
MTVHSAQCRLTRRSNGDMTVPRTREAGAGHMSQTRAGPAPTGQLARCWATRRASSSLRLPLAW